MFSLTSPVSMSGSCGALELHMSVSLFVFLCEMFDKSFISQFDCSVVHLDLVRLYAVIICLSCSNYCSLFLPFAINVVLDDNSVFHEEFVDCNPSFLLSQALSSLGVPHDLALCLAGEF